LMITDPLLEIEGPGARKFLNFKDVDPDGRYLRLLKEDLIERIGIEAIFILLEIICEGANNTVRP
jgi:hypothetical protein